MLTSFSILSDQLTREMLVEADYLATTLDHVGAHCERPGSMARGAALSAAAPLTPLARSILGVLYPEKSAKRLGHAERGTVPPADAASSAKDDEEGMAGSALFLSHFEQVQGRLNAITKRIASHFAARFKEMHRDETHHLHILYLPHAPMASSTSGDATASASPDFRREAPSTILCQVVVRNHAAVEARWKSRQRLAEAQAKRYFCKQPLGWTSQEAEAFYFGDRSAADESDDGGGEGTVESATAVLSDIRNLLLKGATRPAKDDGAEETLFVKRAVVRGCDELVGADAMDAKSLGGAMLWNVQRALRLDAATGAKGQQQKRPRAVEPLSVAPPPPPLVLESEGCGLCGVYYITVTGVAVLGGPLLGVDPSRSVRTADAAMTQPACLTTECDGKRDSDESPQCPEENHQSSMQPAACVERGEEVMAVGLPFNGFLRTSLRM